MFGTKTQTLTVGLAALGLVLFVTNAWLINDAQVQQREIAQRQAQINDGIRLSQLNNQLVQALAAIAVENKDEKVKNLLGQHGITFQQNTPPAGQQRR